MIFNQFDEFGNYLWHYDITGHAIEELVIMKLQDPGMRIGLDFSHRFSRYDRQRRLHETALSVQLHRRGRDSAVSNAVAERLWRPSRQALATSMSLDHNIANTDFIIAVDDNAVMNLARLFNEPEGKAYLVKEGISEDRVENLDLLGLSSTINCSAQSKLPNTWN